jgi:hypothetical protein
MPFPVREVMDRYNPTHILVLANRSKKYVHSFKRRALEKILSASLPKTQTIAKGYAVAP